MLNLIIASLFFYLSYQVGNMLVQGIYALQTTAPAKQYRDLHRTLSPYDQYQWDKQILSGYNDKQQRSAILNIANPGAVAVLKLGFVLSFSAIVFTSLPFEAIPLTALFVLLGVVVNINNQFFRPLHNYREHIGRHAVPKQPESLTEIEGAAINVGRAVPIAVVLVYIIMRLFDAQPSTTVERFLMSLSLGQMTIYMLVSQAIELLVVQPYVRRRRSLPPTVRYAPMLHNPST